MFKAYFTKCEINVNHNQVPDAYGKPITTLTLTSRDYAEQIMEEMRNSPDRAQELIVMTLAEYTKLAVLNAILSE